MPVSLQEWLPENHLAWFVLEFVAEMELRVLRCLPAGWSGSDGVRAADDGLASALRLCDRRGSVPAARTRRRSCSALCSRCASQAGLVKVGVIAIDGTKVHASASHHSNLLRQQRNAHDAGGRFPPSAAGVSWCRQRRPHLARSGSGSGAARSGEGTACGTRVCWSRTQSPSTAHLRYGLDEQRGRSVVLERELRVGRAYAVG